MAEEWKKLAFFDEVATTFLGLSDAPNSYEVADADKYVKVNAAHDALEFGLVAGAASGLATLDAGSKCAQDPKTHKVSHETGGGDEISIAALAGESAELTTHKAVKAANAILGHVIVEDASLIDVDVDGKLTLGAHAATHKDGQTDEITLNEFGEPVAAVPFAGQQATDLVIHSVANAAARPTPVVAKVCHQQDDDHLYICTAIE